MKIFTIENETNNITLHGSIQEAEAVPNAERFRNEAALAKLAANWPAARLIEIWSSLPGSTEVKKFKDRATAVSRIWKAIQNLDQSATPVTETQPQSDPDRSRNGSAGSSGARRHRTRCSRHRCATGARRRGGSGSLGEEGQPGQESAQTSDGSRSAAQG